MCQMKRFIQFEQRFIHIWTVTFVYVFAFINLVSYTANEHSIYHFCIMMKDFSISFSRVIIVQDFNETVTFYVLFVYKPAFSVIFWWMKRLRVSSQFNSPSILFISTAKPFSLVRGYIEVKINKQEIWYSIFILTWIQSERLFNFFFKSDYCPRL